MRSTRTKMKVLGLVALLVAFVGSLQGVGWGTAATTTDPSGDAGASTVDVTEARHDDNGTNLVWAFQTAASFDPEVGTLDTAQWDLDLNSNGTFNESVDACIQLAPLFNGSGTMRASLKAGCGATVNGTADAVFAGGNDVTVTFSNSFFRGATGFTGTTYNYKLTVMDFGANADVVPNTGTITHAAVSPAGTPTPTPATPTPTPATPTPTPVVGQQDTDTQNVTVNVQGVLSIDALLDLVNLGSVSSGGSSLATSVGQIDYTNTLNDGLNWNVSVAATKLAMTGVVSGTIDCTRMSFTPGSTITSEAGSSGALPAAGSASAFSGACTDTAYSSPVTMSTAAPTSQGVFHQAGSTLQVAVPNTAPAGVYNGTLQYTITG